MIQKYGEIKMRKINILLLSLTVLSLMNVNYYKNNDNKQLEETTNDANLVEARKLNDSISNEEVKISNILKVQYTDEEDGTKSLRFVAGISTLSLDAYFVREEIKTEDNKINMPKKEIQVTSAYTGIQNGNKVSKPSEIFGEEYNYVVAYTLKNIPEEYWFTEINVSLVVNEEISTYRKANVTGAINNYSGILVFSDDHQAVGLDSAVKDTIETVNIPAYCYNITNDEHNLIANENDKTQVLEVGRANGNSIELHFSGSNSLKNITIPYGINKISNFCFGYCTSLTYVSIPESVIKIEENAFYNCNKLVVFIPKNIEYIGNCAFYGINKIFCETNKKISEWDEQWTNRDVIWNVAKSGVYNDIIYFVKNDDVKNVSIWKYIGTASNVIIPNEIDNMEVTTICKYAFYYCDKLKKIEMPDTITTIEERAFSDCYLLEEIIIPEKVSYIGNYAFARCDSIISIELPKSIEYVGEYAFWECKNLDFIYCDGENSLNWNENWNKLNDDEYDAKRFATIFGYVKSEYNEIYDYSIQFINSKESIVITKYKGNEKNVVIPTYINNIIVTGISDYAFSDCKNMITVMIPKSIVDVGQCIFNGCENLQCILLENDHIPNTWEELWRSGIDTLEGKGENLILGYKSVEKFEDYTYYVRLINNKKSIILTQYDGKEENIIIPSEINNIPVTSLGASLFSNCDFIKDVKMSNNVLDIGFKTFYNCKSLKNIILSNNLESINYGAFQLCSSLGEILIPKSVNYISIDNFSCCLHLKTIYCEAETQPSGWYDAPWWGNFSFKVIWGFIGTGEYNNFTYSIQIVDGKKQAILTGYNGDEKEITLINNVDNIPVTDVYFSSNNLESIIIPKSFENIGKNAFSGCKSLKMILCEAENKPTNWYDGSDEDLGYENQWNGSIAIIVWGYKDKLNYGDFSCIVQSINNEENVFITSYNGNEKDITIPNEINGLVVKNVSLSQNKIIEKIILPDTIEEICDSAFANCSSLKEITLSNKINVIGSFAFGGCESIEYINLPNNINEINYSAFGGCTSLKNINLSNCKKIGSLAFAFCTSLKSIIIPESVSEIGFGIFYDCTSLETINFVAESLPTEDYFNYGCNAKIVLGYKEQ